VPVHGRKDGHGGPSDQLLTRNLKWALGSQLPYALQVTHPIEHERAPIAGFLATPVAIA